MRRPSKRSPSHPFLKEVKGKKDRRRLNFRRNHKKVDLGQVRYWVILAVEIVAVIGLAFFTVYSYGEKQHIVGESMDPTLTDGDEVLLNKFAYIIGEPESGDMVAFYPKGNTGAAVSVKRIIAVPGDTVRIANGAVYVNDILVDDVAKTDFIADGGLALEPIKLGAGEYFCLGDNRNNSEDSRFASVGNLTEDMIIGKIWLRVTKGNFGMVQ